ncbi:MAG: sterol desaturase family protein [Sphingomonadaceae bacterium]|nr:sterol desaturase family protein [Sphingomonadaceae bacterium]
MSLWTGILVALAATLAMEGVAYAAHRWVMHGVLWSLHKSHHEPRAGLFEKNDWFAVMFALPSIACIWLGVEAGWHPAWMWVGIGIAGYGAIYFGFHDVIVHRRIAHGYVPKSDYMKRIVQAHRLHHAVSSKHGTVSFGFLWAPPIRRLKAELERAGGDIRMPTGA